MTARDFGLMNSACIGVLVGLVWHGSSDWPTRIVAVVVCLAALALRMRMSEADRKAPLEEGDRPCGTCGEGE
jgi:hypothetical protein